MSINKKRDAERSEPSPMLLSGMSELSSTSVAAGAAKVSFSWVQASLKNFESVQVAMKDIQSIRVQLLCSHEGRHFLHEKEEEEVKEMEMEMERKKERETFEKTREWMTWYQLYRIVVLMGCKIQDASWIASWIFGAIADPTSGLPTYVNKGHYCIEPRYLKCLVYEALKHLQYSKTSKLLTYSLAKEIRQHSKHFVILLGGTSGSGKSTVASLLAARLGITTVLSTDSIRHVLRSFYKEEDYPFVFVSTYQACEKICKDQINVGLESEIEGGKLSKKAMKKWVISGYKSQSACVLEHLERVLLKFEREKRSAIIEGVHLNTHKMTDIVTRHPACIPFLLYISNPVKHLERLVVRGKYMTKDPKENKYIKYFDNIRIIQKHLQKKADKVLIPKIDNTNVDRSIATIQNTIIRVLPKIGCGISLLDDNGKFVVLSRKHENIIHKAWSSKAMRKAMRPLINQKVSKRLLLRRLLAEENCLNVNGTSDNDSFSSSDDDGQVESDIEDEDDNFTTACSLFSTTTKSIVYDDEEDIKNYKKLQEGLSSARHHALRWRAGRAVDIRRNLGINYAKDSCITSKGVAAEQTQSSATDLPESSSDKLFTNSFSVSRFMMPQLLQCTSTDPPTLEDKPITFLSTNEKRSRDKVPDPLFTEEGMNRDIEDLVEESKFDSDFDVDEDGSVTSSLHPSRSSYVEGSPMVSPLGNASETEDLSSFHFGCTSSSTGSPMCDPSLD